MSITPEQMDAWAAREEQVFALQSKLLKENPSIGFVNSLVVAGDMISAERATELVRTRQVSPVEAINLVGSYARFQWAVDNLRPRSLFKRLPELWVSSDPDDTKPEYLELWRRAFTRNFGTVLDDKRKALPLGRLTIYRGQLKDAPRGIAWTLDVEIAKRFARCGGGRSDIKDGVVLRAYVMAGDVLAYLTRRGESEIIVDPEDLEDMTRTRIKVWNEH